jgi:hypothetical protein
MQLLLGHIILPTTYKILSNILLSKLTPCVEEHIGFIIVDFDATDQLLFILCIRHILEKKWENNEAVHQPFIDFKKAYNSFRREVLYNIIIDFGIPMKLVRLIKLCMTEMYSRVLVGKILFNVFPVKNG